MLICLVLTLFCSLSSLSSQIPGFCDAPPAVTSFYTTEAKQLALREMLTDPFWEDSINVPAELYKPILNALLAVYNATQYAERDSVVECFAIKAFPIPYPYSISVSTDTSVAWVKKLLNNITPTGNAQVDQLMETYGLTKASQFIFSGNAIFSIQSAQPLNCVALAKKFEPIVGVNYSEPEGSVGDGNNIIYSKLNDQITLVYSVGWGDCPSGCISRRYWKFNVLNCEVQFAGASGEHPDIQLSCSNTFQCITEPLCMGWLQDSIQYFQTLVPECNLPQQGIQVQQHIGQFGESIIAINMIIGIDAISWRFYTCDGTFIGNCDITIIGQTCNPAVGLNQYLNSPVIWDCTSGLPGPSDCAISATTAPPNNIIARLSPNPTTAYLRLESDFKTFTTGSWVLLDMTGKIHKESIFAATNLNQSIDIAGLPSGVYALQIRTATAWKAMLWVKQ